MLDHMDDIGDRVKEIRKRLGLTQAELGKHAGGLSKSAVHQWENGGTKPAWDALTALRKNLGINPDWVMQGEGAMLQELGTPNAATLIESGADGLPFDGRGLTPMQRAMLGIFDRLTSSQQDEVMRELEETKRKNEEIIEELTRRKTNHANES